MSELDLRATIPDEYRSACDTMRAALLAGPISDDDWGRSVEGWTDAMSLTAWDGRRCVGHVGAFRFDTVLPGGARLPTAGVTRVGILPTHTRQGILTRLMHRLLLEARAEGRPLASLRASEAVIYGRFGFGIAAESTGVTVDARRARPIRNAAPGSCRILARDEILDVVPPLYERVAQRPGVISRSMFLWRRYLDDALRGDKGGFVVVHRDPAGVDDGFAHYTLAWDEGTFAESAGKGEVHDLWGATPATELALWDHLVSIDLVRRYDVAERPEDDVLRWACADPRSVVLRDRYDEQWVRLLDVERCLRARTYRPVASVSISVVDPLFADNHDTFAISSAGVQRLGPSATADLRVEVSALSAAYLGATSWCTLAAAGRVDGDADAVAAADDLFAHRPTAWSGSFF